LQERTINSLLGAQLLALIFVAAPLMIAISKRIGFIIPKIHFRDILEDIRLGSPLVLSYVVNFILSGSDRYIIALFISTTAVGYYSPAYTLGSFIIFVPTVFCGVLRPLLSHATDNDQSEEVEQLLNNSIKLFFIIAIPFIIGCYVLGQPLLELLANQEVANAAFRISPIVALGALFLGLNQILSNVLFIKMKMKIMFIVNVVSASMNLILNVIFIYLFRNIIVAAATTLLSYLTSFTILSYAIKKYQNIHYDRNAVGKCIFAAVLMGGALKCAQFVINAQSIIGLLSLIVLGAIVYVGILYLSKIFNDKEMRFIRNYVLGELNIISKQQ